MRTSEGFPPDCWRLWHTHIEDETNQMCLARGGRVEWSNLTHAAHIDLWYPLESSKLPLASLITQSPRSGRQTGLCMEYIRMEIVCPDFCLSLGDFPPTPPRRDDCWQTRVPEVTTWIPKSYPHSPRSRANKSVLRRIRLDLCNTRKIPTGLGKKKFSLFLSITWERHCNRLSPC